MEFDFSKKFTPKRKKEFADMLIELSDEIGFKVSSRGWCYIMEQHGYISKGQFDRVADAINDCRRKGLLPVDFVAEEAARMFHGVEKQSDKSILETMQWMLSDVLTGHRYYTPDWWEGEEYYIQVVVEKIDLVTLFRPVCEKYHVPIANSKGWSSISQRAEYARRFKEAEDRGLRCVLLYCGDHDPDGMRISEMMMENLRQVADVRFEDGEVGYDPTELIIDRFGLNYDFIIQNKFTWIDGLETGRKYAGRSMDLSHPSHPNHNMPYVQSYLNKVGARKCEANVVVTKPAVAKALITEAIENYLGPDAPKRFKKKRDEVKAEYARLLKITDVQDAIDKALEMRDADFIKDEDIDDDTDEDDVDYEDEDDNDEEN